MPVCMSPRGTLRALFKEEYSAEASQQCLHRMRPLPEKMPDGGNSPGPAEDEQLRMYPVYGLQ